MKKTIKQLEEELERVRSEYRDSSNRLYEVQSELREIKAEENRELLQRYDMERDMNKTLLEVVRWLVNPETAKIPFRATKDERDERNGMIY